MSEGSAETAPNPSTAQARVLADELARAGVRHVVVCPGSRSAALAIALHEDPRLAVHVHPDERSAAFVALGIGRALAMPAVVVVTSGTAVANLLPAVVEADHGGVPLIVISADRPPELRATGANQTIDQVGLFGGAVRFAVDLGIAEDRRDAVVTWRASVARAVATARGLGGAPGPVHLNVPMREPTVPVADDGRRRAAPFTSALDGRGRDDPWVEVEVAMRRPDEGLVDGLARRVAAVERGLIVVGGDSSVDGRPALTAGAADALSRATGWPILAEGHAAARHAERALRCAAWLVADARVADAHRPDLVLRFGRTTLSPALERWLDARVPQIAVDRHGGWSDAGRSLRGLVAVEPDALALALADRLGIDAGSDWWERWRALDDGAATALDAALDVEAGSELRLVRDLVRSLPDGVPLVVASSRSVRDLDRVLERRPGLVVHANRGASGIDGTVSTALGVALALARPAVALVGDLAFLHDANGPLLSADAARVDLHVVVIDNDGGAIFDELPPHEHAPAFDRLFTVPHGRDLSRLATFHGAAVRVLDAADGLAEAVGAAATPVAGLAITIVRTDRATELERRRELRERVSAALVAAETPLARDPEAGA
jgi:2-succinyl-5-enolpyruvyl-6-hydroxy-3-cyclohexene-1-carboxylate synthase